MSKGGRWTSRMVRRHAGRCRRAMTSSDTDDVVDGPDPRRADAGPATAPAPRPRSPTRGHRRGATPIPPPAVLPGLRRRTRERGPSLLRRGPAGRRGAPAPPPLGPLPGGDPRDVTPHPRPRVGPRRGRGRAAAQPQAPGHRHRSPPSSRSPCSRRRHLVVRRRERARRPARHADADDRPRRHLPDAARRSGRRPPRHHVGGRDHRHHAGRRHPGPQVPHPRPEAETVSRPTRWFAPSRPPPATRPRAPPPGGDLRHPRGGHRRLRRAGRPAGRLRAEHRLGSGRPRHGGAGG